MRPALALLPVLFAAALVAAGPAGAAVPGGTDVIGSAGVGAPVVGAAVTESRRVVAGTVRDNSGAAVPGAQVYGGRFSDRTVTASKGTYRLSVDVDENQLCADGTSAGGSPFGYGITCVSLPAGAEGSTVRVNLTVPVRALATGRVVDAEGTPLHDVALQLNDRTISSVTDADGYYSIRSVPPGSARVCASGSGEHGGTSPTGYLSACVQFAVPAARASTGPDIVLSQPGGAITGTIRDGSAGRGLAGVRVFADGFQSGNNPVQTVSAADGSYVLSGLVDQTFEVCFDGSQATGGGGTAGYGNQCWQYKNEPNGWDTSTTTPVVVHPGTTVSGIDAHLPRWGAITGTITDPTGAPAGGVRVTVERVGTIAGSTTTGSDGTYRLTSLVPGAYAVCLHPADPAASSTGFLDHCVGAAGAGGSRGPTVTTVAANQTSTVNDTLLPAGRLTGVVLDSSSRPVAGAVVSVTHVGGNSVAFDTTDAAGRWTADTDTVSQDDGTTSGRRLIPDDYDVTVSGPRGSDYVSVDHPAAYIVHDNGYGTHTPVVVTGGRTTSISDTLYHGGTLTGVVRDPGGAGLYDPLVTAAFGALDPSDDGSAPYVYGADDGTWSITGLPPGTYSLCARAYGYTTAAPASFLERCPTGGDADGTTTTVTLAEGGAANVDMTMSPAAGLSGRITTAAGHPLFDAQVEVAQDGATVATQTTSTDGSFEVDRLKPGSYTVCAHGGTDQSGTHTSDEAWAVRCWGAAVGAPGAPVTVTAGAVRTGVDTSLPPGAWVGGRVTDAAGDSVEGAHVVLTAGTRHFEVTTDHAGQWLTMVNAGTYTVCATASGHDTGCYMRAGATTPTQVGIKATRSMWNLDITLP